MNKILKFQFMTSLMLLKALVCFLSVPCWFHKGVLGEWGGAHNLYVCDLWSLWATTVTMCHSWGHMSGGHPTATSPKARAFSLLHGSNKVLCTHRPEGDCHWFLGKAFFRMPHWRKMAVCATDAGSAFGGLTEWWIGSSICLHVEGLL